MYKMQLGYKYVFIVFINKNTKIIQNVCIYIILLVCNLGLF